MTTIHDVLNVLWALAPEHYKESWDNIGLQLGHRDAAVTKVLVALDATEAVAEEAERLGCGLVVTHHPLIFSPLKSVTDETPVSRCILAFLERGLGLISMHTNLDCAPEGVNDRLARLLGLENIRVFDDGETAGLIRMGEVREQPLSDFLETVKEALGCPGLRYVSGGRPVRTVAVGGGSCGEFWERLLREGCDSFVTADVKYHQFAGAAASGMNLIDAGHFETEDPICETLVSYLRENFPELTVQKSTVHSGCIRYL